MNSRQTTKKRKAEELSQQPSSDSTTKKSKKTQYYYDDYVNNDKKQPIPVSEGIKVLHNKKNGRFSRYHLDEEDKKNKQQAAGTRVWTLDALRSKNKPKIYYFDEDMNHLANGVNKSDFSIGRSGHCKHYIDVHLDPNSNQFCYLNNKGKSILIPCRVEIFNDTKSNNPYVEIINERALTARKNRKNNRLRKPLNDNDQISNEKNNEAVSSSCEEIITLNYIEASHHSDRSTSSLNQNNFFFPRHTLTARQNDHPEAKLQSEKSDEAFEKIIKESFNDVVEKFIIASNTHSVFNPKKDDTNDITPQPQSPRRPSFS